MKKSHRFLKSPINILMIMIVAGMFVGNIPVHAGSTSSMLFSQYEKGLISEAEFEQKLKELQYNDEDIRQAKAVMGKLDHQQEGYVFESTSKANSKSNLVTPEMEKTGVTSSDGDNIALVMTIGGVSVAAAIGLAFSKKIFAS